MAEPFKLTRIPSLKTVADFRAHCAGLGIELPCEDAIAPGNSPFAEPVPDLTVNGKRIGNRIAIHPMEGWDGTTTGGVTEEMRRRWQRFGESGAKMICGAEAMAVRPDGRANPNQLIIIEQNQAGIAELVGILKKAHAERYGTTDDLVIGFQLTHSGRFCRPHERMRYEPRVAFRHPILDPKFKVTSDAQVFTDDEIEQLIQDYIKAAKIASDVGADFVDLKHCHGYLLHEFLGAHTRPGKFGGSFENRTRILREVVAGIRASGNKIDFAVRLSCFDKVPHRPDPALSVPGKLGPGIPEDFSQCLPYRYGFGVNQSDPTQIDLTETFQFAELCAQLGVKILNTSAGSPYYTPHLQRPAAYPPSDGYQPAYDPLIDVERQVQVVRQIKTHFAQLKTQTPKLETPALVGSGLSYLQEYLPHVAQYLLRHGWADLVGLGRVVLSYPAMLADAATKGELEKRLICRTFSDCTTAPRNGLISGCYPLDKYYTAKPEAAQLKEIKKRVGA
ncbi:MAG: NADH:flavin oxidoreductase [Limisphaerales bacterium]|nr:MAG: NADH:flavin oxidoreductase [Limisphaerales bacterium]KAG0509135.1 MAG: NADH:flavin oxidoreductase [Limisphaerales bacterium]TXT50842.1 MAG: NADH:flavin oxidoreductase [Limisphaerales bacterium]